MKDWLTELGKVIAFGFGNAVGGEPESCYYEVGLAFMIALVICVLLLGGLFVYMLLKKGNKNEIH